MPTSWQPNGGAVTQLRQLSDIHGNPSRFILAEQLGRQSPAGPPRNRKGNGSDFFFHDWQSAGFLREQKQTKNKQKQATTTNKQTICRDHDGRQLNLTEARHKTPVVWNPHITIKD
jgi:hypothetical protein